MTGTDEKGEPLDPNHPWYTNDIDAETLRRRFVERELRNLERAWRDGNVRAISIAQALCREFEWDRPGWFDEAVNDLVEHYTLGKTSHRRGRKSRYPERERQDRIHFTRWDAVKELRERQPELAHIASTWEQSYEAVSDLLRGTEAAGTPRAVADSYKLVQREIREGRGQRYLYL